MTLISVIVALVIEQLRPLQVQRWVIAPLTRYFGFFDRQFNDGDYRHGAVAWLLAVLVPAMLVGSLYLILLSGQVLAAFAFAVVVVYLTLGFRQFSHFFTDVQLALRAGELDRARMLLAEWRGQSGDRLSSNEMARLAIEKGLLASHHFVFAPLFWFALLGPAGALLYRLALFANSYWGIDGGVPETTRFGEFSRRVFRLIDWLPLRLTAIGFAITGDFEDAIYCWRTQAAHWLNPEEGILLASGAGALGVRLGLPVLDVLEVVDRPELGLGEDADPDFMQSTIGLAWRTLVLYLLIMVLIWIAGWV